jgi:hypothetical protein
MRIATSERRCSEGQIKRRGRCIWPRQAQARKPMLRKARLAGQRMREVARCDSLMRWSTTMRQCIPFWIMLP